MSDEKLSLRDAIKRDTGEISWREIRVEPIRDNLILVSAELDLIAVATAVAEDNTAQVAKWLESGLLKKVGNKDTAAWDSTNPKFLGAFVSPFVLLQLATEASQLH